MALIFDSRQVRPGDTFFAIRGSKYNGEQYIEQAITNGAKVIVLPHDANIIQQSDINYQYVENVRKELALMAASSFASMPKHIVGITGTSGKSSTVGYLRQLWEYNDIKAASIGTLGVISNGLEVDSTDAMTSPDPVTLHSMLNTLADEQIDHIALEVSSHGLDQYRLDGVKFTAAAFTNFSQDHLDYHQSMDEYLSAKLRFFKELLPANTPVIVNKDSHVYAQVKTICDQQSLQMITYGRSEADIVFNVTDNILELIIAGQSYSNECAIDIGFQHENIACAVGIAIASGLEIDKAVAGISSLTVAMGRLEKIATYNDADIYVDYAHKPDALEKLLKAIRKIVKGKLQVVFGCGGDRDQQKRPIMGEIANRLADKVIVTDDNPRSEDPALIRKQILQSAPNAIEIGERRKAIRDTILDLQPGDVLIIAGKGHEEYQIIGDIKYRFNDAEEIKKVINNFVI